jgi:hypothetical protein
MPTLSGTDIAYSSYEKDGFVLRKIAVSASGNTFQSAPLPVEFDTPHTPLLSSQPYTHSYGKAHIYPRLLSDDGKLKVGLYASLDEVLGKRSGFAGVDYGEEGEYDIFGSLEDRSQIVTLFVEGYSIRKRAEASESLLVRRDGANQWVIGRLDLTYDAGGAAAGARMEWQDPYSLTRRNTISLAYAYDNQKVSLYAYDDLEGYLGKAGWNYFAGHNVWLSWQYRGVARAVDSQINPRGREVHVRADYFDNSLLDPPEYVGGSFRIGRDRNRYYQYTYDHREYLPVFSTKHTLGIRLTYSTLDRPVDDFFWIRMGGMDYLRGYTYYSIEGHSALLTSLSYRFPVIKHIGRTAGPFFLHQLYGEVFFDRAVWSRETAKDLPVDWLLGLVSKTRANRIENDKRSVGIGLRLKLFTSYSFGNSLFFQAAYSLGSCWPSPSWLWDAPDSDPEREWTYYWGLLFNFPDFSLPGRALPGRIQ